MQTRRYSKFNKTDEFKNAVKESVQKELSYRKICKLHGCGQKLVEQIKTELGLAKETKRKVASTHSQYRFENKQRLHDEFNGWH